MKAAMIIAAFFWRRATSPTYLPWVKGQAESQTYVLF